MPNIQRCLQVLNMASTIGARKQPRPPLPSMPSSALIIASWIVPRRSLPECDKEGHELCPWHSPEMKVKWLSSVSCCWWVQETVKAGQGTRLQSRALSDGGRSHLPFTPLFLTRGWLTWTYQLATMVTQTHTSWLTFLGRQGQSFCSSAAAVPQKPADIIRDVVLGVDVFMLCGLRGRLHSDEVRVASFKEANRMPTYRSFIHGPRLWSNSFSNMWPLSVFSFCFTLLPLCTVMCALSTSGVYIKITNEMAVAITD